MDLLPLTMAPVIPVTTEVDEETSSQWPQESKGGEVPVSLASHDGDENHERCWLELVKAGSAFLARWADDVPNIFETIVIYLLFVGDGMPDAACGQGPVTLPRCSPMRTHRLRGC